MQTISSASCRSPPEQNCHMQKQRDLAKCHLDTWALLHCHLLVVDPMSLLDNKDQEELRQRLWTGHEVRKIIRFGNFIINPKERWTLKNNKRGWPLQLPSWKWKHRRRSLSEKIIYSWIHPVRCLEHRPGATPAICVVPVGSRVNRKESNKAGSC